MKTFTERYKAAYSDLNEASSPEHWVGEQVAVLSPDKKAVLYIGEVVRTQKTDLVVKPNKNTSLAKRQPEVVVSAKEVIYSKVF